MWLNIKTGYTFKQVYGHMEKIAEKCKILCAEAGIEQPYGGIADLGNTFAHIPWQKACKKAGIRPIFGVQIPVTDGLPKGDRRYPFNWMTLIAKKQAGLKEIYALVDLSFQQFYYRQRITYDQINSLTDNVIVLSGSAPRWDLLTKKAWKEVGPQTPYCNRAGAEIAVINNFYVDAEDSWVYEPFADARLRERQTYPIHILSEKEWSSECPKKTPFLNMIGLAANCNVKLPEAPMVKYIGKENIKDWCRRGAIEKGLTKKPEYIARYKREMELIIEKDYVDYFLVVADLIKYAKTKMAVGPARGSSAGSLVCYLMGITEIDPLEHDLYFERFIDLNRLDLPDIDVDFQDDKRHLVVKYLEKLYGKDGVAQIGNINRMKPKSAITRFASALGVAPEDIAELKDAIMERSSGDARAKNCMEDTFSETDVGKDFIQKYPTMEVVSQIESHPSHTGVHAAGILVCNSPITNYCGVNSRDKKRIGMLDKRDAEDVGLLKIDALGLRTLSVIAEVCDQIGKPYEWMYSIPTDDPEAYKVFNDHRFNGIFQFEGPAVQGLAKQMPIENMEDIAALGALGRPGPLMSGGANKYIHYRNNPHAIEYISNHPVIVAATKSTYGVVIYQEQMLKIGKDYGLLSWHDTGLLRKAATKSKGKEFFDQFRDKFIPGALSQGETEEDATKVWEAMYTFGAWAFNKSHAISYGLVSYLCGYMKAHYPMEFLVANLKHSKNERSALKILRDAVENDGIKYVYFSPEKSIVDWSVQGDVLYGGFISLNGMGPVKAKAALKHRVTGTTPPPGMRQKIHDAISPFKYLYPGKELYGDFYTDPKKHHMNNPAKTIAEIQNVDGEFSIIGCMIKKNLRDANEACFVTQRDGKHLEGHTAWLNITIEDDTDQIMCKIKIQDYERLGKVIAETGKEDKDWYLVYGKKVNGWSLLFVENIMKITRKL